MHPTVRPGARSAALLDLQGLSRRPSRHTAAACGGRGAGARAAAGGGVMRDERKQYIADAIRGVPDFPKKGINFHDITTLLLDPKAFQWSVDDFVERYLDKRVDVVAGFEARGFFFGAPLALALKVPFVPLRKPGKLPGETITAEYQLEYGSDKIEMHVGAVKPGDRVVLIDDLIATGGTLGAGIKLIKQAGGEVVEAACVIEMPALNGRAKLGDTPLYTQIDKEGD